MRKYLLMQAQKSILISRDELVSSESQCGTPYLRRKKKKKNSVPEENQNFLECLWWSKGEERRQAKCEGSKNSQVSTSSMSLD